MELFGGGEGEAASEDGESAEEVLFGGVEELVAPIQGGPEGVVVLDCGGGASGEYFEGVVEAFGEPGERHHAEPSRSQFDGQRQPGEPFAYLPDGGRRLAVRGERGLGGAGPVEEQLNRWAFFRNGLQGLGLVGGFAFDTEDPPAGDEQVQRRASGEQFGGELGHRFNDLLAVVDHQ
jgi:hypothetical protein